MNTSIVGGAGNSREWRTCGEEAADVAPVVVDAGPVSPREPPGGVDPAVVAADEDVQVVRRARGCGERGTGREEAADRAPVIVDAGPVGPREPPGRVDAAVVAADEDVQVVGGAAHGGYI